MSSHAPLEESLYPEEPMIAGLSPEEAALAQSEAQLESRETGGQFRRGVVLGLGAAGVTAGILLGHDSDWKFSVDLPFVPEAQHAVESVDEGLIKLAEFLTPASVAALAGVKLASRKSPRLAEADKESSKELTSDGKDHRSMPRRFLQNYASGWVPVTAATGVAISAIMAGVGYEISEGPNRPIGAVFDEVPGDGPLSIIEQTADCNPMLECHVPRSLGNNVMKVAQERGIMAGPADFMLPSFTYHGSSYTALLAASEQPAGSPLAPEGGVDCDNVPVVMDKAADIPEGAHISINGIPATVVDITSGKSAINRIYLETSREALANCLEQNADDPDDMILVRADKQTTEEILDEAKATVTDTKVVATVADKQQYIDKSEEFWKANSKPVTNTLALMGGIVALGAMAGTSLARLLRNKRNWAVNMAQGVQDKQLRLTELVRATKDGVAASAIGVGVSFVAPAINLLESGLRVSVDFRTIMVGSAVGLLGSVGGAIPRLIRPNKIINEDEDTR